MYRIMQSPINPAVAHPLRLLSSLPNLTLHSPFKKQSLVYSSYNK